jgi:hypothetical protein
MRGSIIHEMIASSENILRGVISKKQNMSALRKLNHRRNFIVNGNNTSFSHRNIINSSSEAPLFFATFFSSLAVFGLDCRETKCDKGTVPPQFGSRIPFFLVNHQKRYFNTTTGTMKKSNFPDDIPSKEDRGECLVCKKYSRGPCGTHFKKWLECIDTNSGNEAVCDELVLPLDQCLKKNQEYYDNINAYDTEDKDEDENRWKDFILELESGEEESIMYDQFPPDKVPDMQIRLEKKMGIIQFHPEITRNGSKHLLMLGYVKDQDSTILAGASADELVDFDEMRVLRFHTSNNTRDIVACAIYTVANDDTPDDIIIYRKVERLPVS